MKFRTMCIGTVFMVFLLPFMMGQQGCQPTTGDGTNSDGTTGGSADDLTDQEKEALVAACNAPGAIGQAAEVAQNSTDDLDTSSSQQAPKEATYGTCPEVTKDGTIGTTLDLTIDFGEQPCDTLTVPLEDGTYYTYTCSGSATGSFSLIGQSISLTFDSISCNEETLEGTASLTYSLLVPGVKLEGSWDLTYTFGNDSIGTAGSGTASYVPVLSGCCDVTSIETFTGNITEDGYEWSTTMTNILVSLEKYYSFIPYSGSITIDGPEIRALTITFNENSPTTGSVTVSIENGRTITVSLYELEEWLEAYPVE